MIELKDRPLLLINDSFSSRARIDQCFAKASIKPRIVAEFENPETLVNAALSDGLAGIVTHNLPHWFDESKTVKIMLEDPTPSRTIVLYWRHEHLPFAVQVLSELIIERFYDISRKVNEFGLRPHRSINNY
jgi:DNA-binding transcriptional LysR family regulator